jgi:two-component system sensor histidine kinase YcbA
MIFYNLISNSIDSIKEKGLEKGEGQIVVTSDLINNNYIFTIEDNGTGIDRSYIKDKIYEPGFTTKYDEEGNKKGTGIGLYYAKEILENSFYGSVRCESTFGKSTRFILEIPKHK